MGKMGAQCTVPEFEMNELSEAQSGTFYST